MRELAMGIFSTTQFLGTFFWWRYW